MLARDEQAQRPGPGRTAVRGFGRAAARHLRAAARCPDDPELTTLVDDLLARH